MRTLFLLFHEAVTGGSERMAGLTVDCLELGQLPTNTYLVMNTETKECLIIDPSDGVENIISWLDDHQAKPVSIWLTHGHDDHIGSVSDLKRKYGLFCYVSKEEEEFCESIYYNLSSMFGHPRTIEPDLFFLDGQKIKILGTEATVLLTPGHTVGSACYYFPQEKLLFSGDTLFEESVGRSDFPGGSTLSLIASVKRLMTLPDDVTVLPGHGGRTSIGHERKYNPYVNR